MSSWAVTRDRILWPRESKANRGGLSRWKTGPLACISFRGEGVGLGGKVVCHEAGQECQRPEEALPEVIGSKGWSDPMKCADLLCLMGHAEAPLSSRIRPRSGSRASR